MMLTTLLRTARITLSLSTSSKMTPQFCPNQVDNCYITPLAHLLSHQLSWLDAADLATLQKMLEDLNPTAIDTGNQ